MYLYNLKRTRAEPNPLETNHFEPKPFPPYISETSAEQLLKIMKKLVASILHDLRLQDSNEIDIDSKITVRRLQYLLGAFLSQDVSEQEIEFLVKCYFIFKFSLL